MNRLWPFVILSLLPLSSVAAEHFYPLPGDPVPNMAKTEVRGSDNMVFIYGKPFAVVSSQEMTGNPLFTWLRDDVFTYKGCEPETKNPFQCHETWRLGFVMNGIPILAPSLKHIDDATPIFRGPYIAWQNILPNGNLGCFVYEWETKQYVVENDTGYKPPTDRYSYGGAPRLDLEKKEVTCYSLEEWESHQSESGLGSTVVHRPKVRKAFRAKLN